MESDVTYAEVKFRDGSGKKAEIKTDAKTDSQAQAEKKTSPKILIALSLVIFLLLTGMCVLITLYSQASSRVPELEKQMAQLQLNHSKALLYIGCKNRSAQDCSQFFLYRGCPTDWLLYSGKCYFFSKDTLPWEGSRLKCLTSQADLVIINDQKEQLFISNTTKTDTYWIGLTDVDTEGAWKWVNGLSLQPETFWDINQPDDHLKAEDCATVGSRRDDGASSLWNDDRCERPNKFICEKEAEDRKMDFTP